MHNQGKLHYKPQVTLGRNYPSAFFFKPGWGTACSCEGSWGPHCMLGEKMNLQKLTTYMYCKSFLKIGRDEPDITCCMPFSLVTSKLKLMHSTASNFSHRDMQFENHILVPGCNDFTDNLNVWKFQFCRPLEGYGSGFYWAAAHVLGFAGLFFAALLGQMFDSNLALTGKNNQASWKVWFPFLNQHVVKTRQLRSPLSCGDRHCAMILTTSTLHTSFLQ